MIWLFVVGFIFTLGLGVAGAIYSISWLEGFFALAGSVLVAIVGQLSLRWHDKEKDLDSEVERINLTNKLMIDLHGRFSALLNLRENYSERFFKALECERRHFAVSRQLLIPERSDYLIHALSEYSFLTKIADNESIEKKDYASCSELEKAVHLTYLSKTIEMCNSLYRLWKIHGELHTDLIGQVQGDERQGRYIQFANQYEAVKFMNLVRVTEECVSTTENVIERLYLSLNSLSDKLPLFYSKEAQERLPCLSMKFGKTLSEFFGDGKLNLISPIGLNSYIFNLPNQTRVDL